LARPRLAAAPGGGQRRRARVAKRAKLAGLAVLGLSTVSIPVTIALVLSATGTSDVLTLGAADPRAARTTPAAAVARVECEPRRGHYALTFEDGPFPETTTRLVAALRRARAVATFFDVGRRAAARPDLVEAQRSVGHVANHGWTHLALPAVGAARRVAELQATARALGYPDAFVRPPFGESDDATDRDIRRTGLTPVYWTVDAGDGSARDIIRHALTVRPGGVILLRDGAAPTVAAVPRIVAGLRERGLCPGFLARSDRVVRAANGRAFSVTAVKP
jgi:peptidoglycan/xylan/chitin deacetylase (PgdA/CDA1 family)